MDHRTYGLSVEAVDAATSQARKEGAFAGASAALAGGILGSKVFKFNRTTNLVCIAATGALAGWQFTQAFTSSYLARAQVERRRSEAAFADPAAVSADPSMKAV